MSGSKSAPKLIEGFFRHEYGKLIAVLVRRVGAQHFDLVEDSVQSALMTGLESWTLTGLPESPSAWLYKVAANNLLGTLRQDTGREKILLKHAEEALFSLETTPEHFSVNELQDDMLRMLFVCCNDTVPIESQLVFALKSLCGFTIHEIAHHLFISEANVYKRFSRARNSLQQHSLKSWELDQTEYTTRLPAVSNVLYLIFTEGFLSVNHEFSIRQELCREAMWLTTMLVNNKIGQTPETFALLALMYFHMARMNSRQDSSGGLLLLEQQDRSLWDRQKIQIGLTWLEKSASGNTFSRYHAEAGIAAEHCLAPSFSETRWEQIVENYLFLEQASPSAIYRLNRAVAVAEWQGPESGLSVLQGFESPSWLIGSYLWSAVLADLHRRCGHIELAENYRDLAIMSAPTQALKTLLQNRFNTNK